MSSSSVGMSEFERWACATLDIDKHKYTDFKAFYNTSFGSYDNSIYSDSRTCIVHWENYNNVSWFNQRMDFLFGLLRAACDIDNVTWLDLGFSVPYVFDKPDLLGSNKLTSILVDKEASCMTFYNALANRLGIEGSLPTVIIGDISDCNTSDIITRELLSRSLVGSRLFVSAIEVLEHLKSVNCFWQFIESIKSANIFSSVDLYITLPIGPLIPSHEVSFDNVMQARTFLQHRARLVSEFLLRPDVKDTPGTRAINNYSLYCCHAFA